MLRKIRIILAIIFFVGINLLILDMTGVLHHYLAWMAQMQLLPAILSGSLFVVLLLLLLTLLFGRVYCSLICPLGVMQDGFVWLGGKVKKNRFHFTRARNVLRYCFLGGAVVVAVVGLFGTTHVGDVDPYSNYGRIATQLFLPAILWVNNLLAGLAEHFNSYLFYPVRVWISGGVSLVVAAAVFVAVALVAFRDGRIICNTLCPVGALLSLVSRYSLFRPVIDTVKCNGCTKCARNCKASCIDPEHHTIDMSRCVACMDCLENCKQGAISLRPVAWTKGCRHKVSASDIAVDDSRRKFLVTTAAVTVSSVLMAQEKKVDGGLAVIEDKKLPVRKTPLHPAGSASARQFTAHCTSCQLCVAQCPNHVLRPNPDSVFFNMLQPAMGFEHGFCRPDCTICGEVCPSGAIRPFTPEQKAATSVGFAVVVPDNCIAASEGVRCGTCARHCPVGAIRMVPVAGAAVTDSTAMIPTVDENRCLGCGACEYYCPSRPVSAIYIEGREEAVQQ